MKWMIVFLMLLALCTVASGQDQEWPIPEATPTAEELEMARLMELPREELPACARPAEKYIDAVTGSYAYDRSFNEVEGEVCVRGGQDLFWQEIAGYFSKATETEIQLADLRWVDEFDWFEVEAADLWYYYPVFSSGSIELRKRLPECQEQLRELPEDERPVYGDFFICTSADHLEPDSPRISVGE